MGRLVILGDRFVVQHFEILCGEIGSLGVASPIPTLLSLPVLLSLVRVFVCACLCVLCA